MKHSEPSRKNSFRRELLFGLLLLVLTLAAGIAIQTLLQIQALKRLSAFTVNLTYNLEPRYTIALAFLLFGEGREINFSSYLGIALIVVSVLLQTVRAIGSKKIGR